MGPLSDHLLRLLDEFLWVLRREGFSISTAQAIHAVHAAALVGFASPITLRDALGAVVVERPCDVPRFRAAFASFFAKDRAHAGDLLDRLRARGFGETELGVLRELLDAAAQHSGASSEAHGIGVLAGTEMDLDALLLSAGIGRALAPMTNALQVGFFTQQVAAATGVFAAASLMSRIRQALREALGDDRGTALGRALDEELDRMRRQVRDHVERTLTRRLSALPSGEGRSVQDLPWSDISPAQRIEVRRLVRLLAERLRGAYRVRSRRARQGRIDLRRTVRKGLATFGVPVHLVRRIRRRDKTKIIVLCDVSDSVRGASRFLLEVLHAVQDLFLGARSFVFVSEIGETTKRLTGAPGSAALAGILDGSVVNLASNSNYGRALRAFDALVGRDIDRRTTVLILGDGRTNYLSSGVDVVRRLRDRAHAVAWICPESSAAWGTGDSAMVRYAAASTEVFVARTARELAAALHKVMRIRG